MVLEIDSPKNFINRKLKDIDFDGKFQLKLLAIKKENEVISNELELKIEPDYSLVLYGSKQNLERSIEIN